MLLLTESLLYVGHWRYPWQCPQGLFHDSQEGARWSPSHFINMLQPAETTQLQQEEHSARQATLCYQYEHRVWALLTQLHQDNLHRRVVEQSEPSKRLGSPGLEPLTSKGHHPNKGGIVKELQVLLLSLSKTRWAAFSSLSHINSYAVSAAQSNFKRLPVALQKFNKSCILLAQIQIYSC